MSAFTLDELTAIIQSRTASDAANSYTKSLLDEGPSRVAKKFGEEAVELIVAVLERERPAIVAESADVLYHLLVLLQTFEIPLADVVGELGRRTAVSGHEEKAGRPSR